MLTISRVARNGRPNATPARRSVGTPDLTPPTPRCPTPPPMLHFSAASRSLMPWCRLPSTNCERPGGRGSRCHQRARGRRGTSNPPCCGIPMHTHTLTHRLAACCLRLPPPALTTSTTPQTPTCTRTACTPSSVRAVALHGAGHLDACARELAPALSAPLPHPPCQAFVVEPRAWRRRRPPYSLHRPQPTPRMQNNAGVPSQDTAEVYVLGDNVFNTIKARNSTLETPAFRVFNLAVPSNHMPGLHWVSAGRASHRPSSWPLLGGGGVRACVHVCVRILRMLDNRWLAVCRPTCQSRNAWFATRLVPSFPARPVPSAPARQHDTAGAPATTCFLHRKLHQCHTLNLAALEVQPERCPGLRCAVFEARSPSCCLQPRSHTVCILSPPGRHGPRRYCDRGRQ